jgi:DNA polymerase-3 subunit delta
LIVSSTAPVVYLLHGEDDFGMAGFLSAMEEKLGDPASAQLNITRLEGGLSLEELREAVLVIPFLAPRRLVVVENVSKKLGRGKEEQEKFLNLLERVPQSTALVLLEHSELKTNHWLLQWALANQEKAFVRSCALPKGGQMVSWIRKYANDQGGEITPQAASLLAENVGEVPRMAASELDKLMAYVNYARPVDVDDIEAAAAFVAGGGDYFKFIDAVAQRDGRQAMDMLKKLLDEQDPLALFFSLVGHFRLLLQTREIYEKGGGEGAVAEKLGIHPYRAKKLTAQARLISLETLEQIYFTLRQLDLEIKTGQIDSELALEVLVANLVG